MLEMVIVSRNKVDFSKLLGLVVQTTKRRIADGVDNLKYSVGNDEKLVRCLGDLFEVPHTSPQAEHHAHFSGVFLVRDYTLVLLNNVAPNLAQSVVGTTEPGTYLAIVSGSLAHWRESVLTADLEGSDNAKKYAKCVRDGFSTEGFTL